MRIKEGAYSAEGFKKYLIENAEEIFCDDKRKKWLKIYCLLVSDDKWPHNLFKENEFVKMGDIYKVTPQADICKLRDYYTDEEKDEETPHNKGVPSEQNDECYFVEEYCPGLLLLYTSANNEQYRETLADRVKHTIGTTRVWFKPDLFRRFWAGVVEDTGGYVYRFTSRREMADERPCKIRPELKRRFSYTGDDATQTIEELEESYGVLPDSIYIQAKEDLKIHITKDGLYSAQDASRDALNLFFKYLDSLKTELLNMRKIAKSFKYDVVSGRSNLKFVSIDEGVITLKKRELNENTVGLLIKELDNFSFIDEHIETGSLSFTATVVDYTKGCVFDISASESKIQIVPKYRLTFESFIDFYRGVVESIDEQAELAVVRHP